MFNKIRLPLSLLLWCFTLLPMDNQPVLFCNQETKTKIKNIFDILYDVWEKHASNAQALRTCNVGKHGVAAGLLFKNGLDLNLWRTIVSGSILTLNYLGSRWLHDKYKKNEKQYFEILGDHSKTLLKLVQGNLTWKKHVGASRESDKNTLNQELELLETWVDQAENMGAGFGHFGLVNWRQIDPTRVTKQFFASETTQKLKNQLEGQLQNIEQLKNVNLENSAKSLVDQAQKSSWVGSIRDFVLEKPEKTPKPPIYWNMRDIISILHGKIDLGRGKLSSN